MIRHSKWCKLTIQIMILRKSGGSRGGSEGYYINFIYYKPNLI